MAKNSDEFAAALETENTGGVLTGLLAEEDVFDRRALWRLGSWGVGTIGVVTLAVFASQSSMMQRREQTAAADLARRTQQIQLATKESQNETRRLASEVETLNGDRDRLYSRVTVLEQGLDSVTGAIAKQKASLTPQAAPAATEPQPTAQNATPAAPAPAVSPVTTTVAAKTPDKVSTPDKSALEAIAPQQTAAIATTAASTASKPSPSPTNPTAPAAAASAPLVAAKSMMAPPDPAATKLVEPDRPPQVITSAPMPEVVASAPVAGDTEPEAAQATPNDVAVQRTEFGVDVGGANSIPGLRALWRGLLKSKSNAALTTLRPIIVIREGKGGLGMQLRLVAGPLSDAAAAAKICAGLIENNRPCSTAVFDGQRLAMKEGEVPEAIDAKAAAVKPGAAKPLVHRRGAQRHEESAKKPDPPSTLSSFFSRR